MHQKHSIIIKRRDIKIAISVFLSGLSCFGLLYYYQSLLPELSSYFYISEATSSLSISSATFGMAIGLVLTMFVADRYNRKKVVGFCLLASAIIAFATSFQNVFFTLVILNFLKGFLLAGTTSVCLSYIAEEVSGKRQIAITGFYIAGNAIGGMFGRVLAADVAHHYSWQQASKVIGIVCLIFAILFFVFAPKSRFFKPKKESIGKLIIPNIKLIFHKTLLPYYFVGFLLLGTFVSLYNYIAFFVLDSPFNIPKGWMSYIYLLYITGVFGAMSMPFWIRILKKPSYILQAMSIFSILSIAIIFLENIFFVIVGIGFFTYCFFVSHTACSKKVADISKEKKSSAIAIYLLFYYTGSSVLGSFTGIFLAAYQWQLFLALLMFILAIVFVVFFIKNPFVYNTSQKT